MSGARQRQLKSKHPIVTPSGSSSSEGESRVVFTPSSTQQSQQGSGALAEAVRSKASKLKAESGKDGLSILDVLRMLGGVVLMSCALSWFITDGESLVWNIRPKWARWEVLKNLFKPELVLTDAQLAKYDGSDPSLPIYVGINGSVFDVTAGRQTYGPGGSYHVFAGVDAARGFITGCFIEDRTYDLRGVEEMYLEDDEELDSYESGRLQNYNKLSPKEKRDLDRRAKERRKKAWSKVEGTVKHWDGFYRHHERYFYVGRVMHKDLSGEPMKKLCKAAQRPKQKSSKQEQSEDEARQS